MRNADLYILVHKMQKFAFKLFLCFLFMGYFFSANIKQANAWTINYGDDACGVTFNGSSKPQKSYNPLDTNGTKQTVDKLNKSIEKLKEFCDKLSKHVEEAAKNNKNIDENVFPTQKLTWGGWKPETVDEYQARFQKIMKQNPSFQKEYETLKNEYNRLNEELETTRKAELAEHNRAVAAKEYQPCGDKYPRGCPEGMECYGQTSTSVQGTAGMYSTTITTYTCKKAENVRKPLFGDKPKPVEQGTDTSTVVTTTAGLSTTTAKTDETGKTTVESPKLIDITRVEGSNASCNIDGMRKKYQSSCYSCIIVKTLITTFIDACSNAEQVTTEAAVIILQIGLMLWITFFVLQQISSFTNIEPAAMINTLFVTLFKCLVAYVVIVSGVATFTTYVIEPIMNAGASYGIALLEASPSHLELTPSTTYVTKGTKVVSPQLINDIMGFTESMDKTVSTNLIIGHSLTCHSINAGAWRWTLTLVGKEAFTLAIPNFWIWLCGAAIWFCGFMLTLGFSYYLLDISFKMGFAVIAFPILMALWPFKPTASKLKSCVQMIIKAAGTFMMLGMTGSYALILVSKSIRNLDEFYKRIEAGDSEWISETFALTGPYFIIIVFAYLYSLKLIGSTVKDYVDRFFEGGIINKTPMHTEMTRMTDIAKKATVGAGKKVIKTTAKLGGKVTSKVANKAFSAAKFVKSKFKGSNSDVSNDDVNDDNDNADEADNQ